MVCSPLLSRRAAHYAAHLCVGQRGAVRSLWGLFEPANFDCFVVVVVGCWQVSERLLLEAAVVALQKAPLPAEEPGEGGHADLAAVPRLVGAAMEGGVVAALELVGKRVEALDDAGEVAASLDVLELAQVLQAEFFTSFGCFINPDDIGEPRAIPLAYAEP